MKKDNIKTKVYRSYENYPSSLDGGQKYIAQVVVHDRRLFRELRTVIEMAITRYDCADEFKEADYK